MAITYTGTNGVFTQEKPIKDSQKAALTLFHTTLMSELDAVGDAIEAGTAGSRRDIMAQVGIAFDRYRRSIANHLKECARLYLLRLFDQTTILNELAIHDASTQRLLRRFVAQMRTDSATVDRTTVTVGSVTAGSGNVGNGVVLVDKELDGYNAPIRGGIAVPAYDDGAGTGYDSELAASETVSAECVKDAQGNLIDADRAAAVTSDFIEGEETFLLYGQPQQPYDPTAPVNAPLLASSVEGSGNGPLMKTLQSHAILRNINLESWTTSNVPDNWNDQGGGYGTAGTNVLKETTTIYRGASSMRFKGDGTTATIKRTQNVPANLLVGKRRYYFSIHLIGDATIAAGDIAVLFTGTGYTAGSSEKVSVAAASIPTSWTRYGFWWNTPKTIPTDLAIEIQWNSTPTNNKNIYFDNIAFGPVTYHGGVSFVAIAGATPFKFGDIFTCPLTNDAAGEHQEFARRFLKIQYPSSGTPSISD